MSLLLLSIRICPSGLGQSLHSQPAINYSMRLPRSFLVNSHFYDECMSPSLFDWFSLSLSLSGAVPGNVEAVLGGNHAPLGRERAWQSRGTPAAAVPGQARPRQEEDRERDHGPVRAQTPLLEDAPPRRLDQREHRPPLGKDAFSIYHCSLFELFAFYVAYLSHTKDIGWVIILCSFIGRKFLLFWPLPSTELRIRTISSSVWRVVKGNRAGRGRWSDLQNINSWKRIKKPHYLGQRGKGVISSLVNLQHRLSNWMFIY